MSSDRNSNTHLVYQGVEPTKDPSVYAVYIENVKQQYGKKLVLNNVDLSVRPGELVSLVGPSGCGKSTLLRLFLAAEQPKKGFVFLHGKMRTHPDPECGIVYQKYSIFPHLTVLENIAIGPVLTGSGIMERILRLDRAKKGAILKEAKHFLEIMGLEDAAGKHSYELSGGMQQRVAIAQALIMRPRVLLLDEPFSALDPWTREQLQAYLVKLWSEQKMTVFFVTHDIEEAIYLGTRIVVLAQYYKTGLGKGRGSRIIADFPIPTEHPRPLEFKYSDILNGIVSRIRKIAFDEKGGQDYVHIGNLLLEHPDSFHTAPEEEWKK